MTIYWTDFAKSELKKIYVYYDTEVGATLALGILQQLLSHVDVLIDHPEFGRVEELLMDRPGQFRFLVCQNYKIIYLINNLKERIEILDVFDTRLNPEKIKRS